MGVYIYIYCFTIICLAGRMWITIVYKGIQRPPWLHIFIFVKSCYAKFVQDLFVSCKNFIYRRTAWMYIVCYFWLKRISTWYLFSKCICFCVYICIAYACPNYEFMLLYFVPSVEDSNYKNKKRYNFISGFYHLPHLKRSGLSMHLTTTAATN